jgi:hypothetical protein
MSHRTILFIHVVACALVSIAVITFTGPDPSLGVFNFDLQKGWTLAYLSPNLLWLTWMWATHGQKRQPIGWLFLWLGLAGLGVFAVYHDWRQCVPHTRENLEGSYGVTSMVVVFQWFFGLTLVVPAVLRRLATPQETKPGASPSLSHWLVASLSLLTCAVLMALVTGYCSTKSAVGPADGAAIAFLVSSAATVSWLCALLGTICGAIGVRQPSSRTKLGFAVLALNALFCIIPAFWLVPMIIL